MNGDGNAAQLDDLEVHATIMFDLRTAVRSLDLGELITSHPEVFHLINKDSWCSVYDNCMDKNA